MCIERIDTYYMYVDYPHPSASWPRHTPGHSLPLHVAGFNIDFPQREGEVNTRHLTSHKPAALSGRVPLTKVEYIPSS